MEREGMGLPPLLSINPGESLGIIKLRSKRIMFPEKRE